jgi:hypothetical protein
MTTEPNPDLVDGFRKAGKADGPCYSEAVLAYAATEEEGLRIAHERFRFSALGWAVNSELPTVAGFEAATKAVRPDDLAESIAAGPDPETHLAAIRKYVDAGYDHIVLTAPGPDQAGFIDFFERDLKPKLAEFG